MRSIALAVLVLATTTPVLAQSLGRLEQDGRFTLRETAQGLIRMDKRTGAISVCSGQGQAFACRLVPDDRTAMEEEINKLRAENETLRRGGTTAQVERHDQPTMTLPSDQEIDRALSLFERIWRRLREMTRENPP